MVIDAMGDQTADRELLAWELAEPAGSPRRFSAAVFSRIQAATDPVVLPFTKVSRQTLEEKAGGAGVTAQTGRVQQGTAQRSPGKVGGIHGRWDLRVSPTRSARGYTVFIVRDSFSSALYRSHTT